VGTGTVVGDVGRDGRRRVGAGGRVLLLAVTAAVLAPWPAAAAGAAAAPEFSLTPQELRTLTRDLPAAQQGRILAAAPRFLNLVSQVLDEPPELVVLVDKNHLLAADDAPPDLVQLGGYPLAVSRNDLSLRKLIMPEVLAMVSAARADGVTLLFSSSYRSYDYQKLVYEREVKTYGQAAADRESAHPGASQHQLGTAIDFGSITDAFAQTKAGQWLAAHAGEYGFTLSYPRGYESVTGYRWESWHYRYITRPAARLQKEFFDDVQQYLLEFLHDHRAALEAARVR
jgi:D-alanyl-D-alanine carboxypeptidase